MAATNVPVNQLSSDSPGVMAQTSMVPVACDATNGNSCFNDGTTRLIFTATATDTVQVSFPGVAHQDAIAIASGHVVLAGPFEVDEFGPTIVFKAGVVTTLVAPVSIPPLA